LKRRKISKNILMLWSTKKKILMLIPTMRGRHRVFKDCLRQTFLGCVYSLQRQ
jgi:hypothetical protein